MKNDLRQAYGTKRCAVGLYLRQKLLPMGGRKATVVFLPFFAIALDR